MVEPPGGIVEEQPGAVASAVGTMVAGSTAPVEWWQKLAWEVEVDRRENMISGR
jgi:hypothetical protein